MNDYKKIAKELKEKRKSEGIEITMRQALDQVAKNHGFKSREAMASTYKVLKLDREELELIIAGIHKKYILINNEITDTEDDGREFHLLTFKDEKKEYYFNYMTSPWDGNEFDAFNSGESVLYIEKKQKVKNIEIPKVGNTYEYINGEPMYEWITITEIIGDNIYYEIEEGNGFGEITLNLFWETFKNQNKEESLYQKYSKREDLIPLDESDLTQKQLSNFIKEVKKITNIKEWKNTLLEFANEHGIQQMDIINYVNKNS